MRLTTLTVAMCSLIALLGGCSSQDFGRPVARMGDVIDSGKSYAESEDEDEVLDRDAELNGQNLRLPKWPVQFDHPRQSRQQKDARNQRRGQADLARLALLVRRHLATQNRNEDDVVDAQDNFQNCQRHQADPN